MTDPAAAAQPATFVFVPGAGGDAWQWHLVERELHARGRNTIAVTLPSGDDRAGWAEYAAAIVSAATGRGPVIIVAQSLGGFSAPLACARLPVEALVLLNAMIPLPGETGSDWWSDTKHGDAFVAHLADHGLAPDGISDTDLYFHDTPPAILRELLARGEPAQSGTPMDQPWPLAAWPNVPTSVLAGRDDRLFPIEFQRRIARERLGLEVEELPGGHMLALSHPAELADRLTR